MHRKGLLWVVALAFVALAVACGGNDQKPASLTSPSAAIGVGDANAAADDAVTLKVNGPTPKSPVGGEQLTVYQPTVTFDAATGKYVQGESFTYRVQLLDAGGAVLQTLSGKGTSYTFNADLNPNTEYRWRVRAELEGHVGPWSSNATFRSMEKPQGYIRGNEIYDPLTDGKSVGIIHGPHTFIPGVGIRFESLFSYIEYKLEEPLLSGEYSALLSGLSTDGQGGKTKVFGMSEGTYDIVTNAHRMTCEKRNDGTVAWRFITSDQQIDTEGHERVKVDFHESWTYFWKATWGGAFNLSIRVDGPDGPEIYNFGKGYRGQYDPNPHYVFAGVPIGRTGPDGGTPPGMIIRQVWVSSNPRPGFANQ